jgi:hypothetical protein
MRMYPFALAAVLLVAAQGVPGAAQRENDMCKGRTAEATATELMNRLSSPIVRVLVRLKGGEGGGQDRAALDHDTAQLAAALRQEGALLAEPIDGQPLVVVEIGRDQLPRLARHPQVACIAEDALGRTQ